MKTTSSIRKEKRKKNKHCLKNKNNNIISATALSKKEEQIHSQANSNDKNNKLKRKNIRVAVNESEEDNLVVTKNHSSNPKQQQHEQKKQKQQDDNKKRKKENNNDIKSKKNPINTNTNKNNNYYSKLNPDIASALEADDKEIKLLEDKLGISKNKKKLSKEYSKLECYGDDFLDFLDDLDGIVDRCLVVDKNNNGDDDDDSLNMEESNHDDDEDSDSDDDDDDNNSGSDMDYSSSEEEDIKDKDEEIVPMKEGPPLRDESDDDEDNNDDDMEDKMDNDEENSTDNNNSNIQLYSDDEISNNSNGSNNSDENEEEDHAENDTYQPSKGEDIYGNPLSNTKSTTVSKYIPPHLRNKQNTDNTNKNKSNLTEEGKKEDIISSDDIPIEILRSITRILNKLSNDTIDTITKQIIQLYTIPSNSILQINTCIFDALKKTIFEKAIIMNKLIPLYSSIITGIHIFSISGSSGSGNCNTIDLSSFMIEHLIIQYRITRSQEMEYNNNNDDKSSTSTTMKTSCNYILFISYLYLFGVISSQLMYDIINEMIQLSSSSNDIIPELYLEHLVLIMSNVGFQLRSDDPSSLKHIILTLQQQQQDDEKDHDDNESSSRYAYLMETLTQIKNNTKKKNMKRNTNNDNNNDMIILHYKKYFGRMKKESNSSITDSTSSILNITLYDILNIPKRGRWWKVGASWKDKNMIHNNDNDIITSSSSSKDHQLKDNNKYIQTPLQKTYFNTQLRKSIFQTIITSTDIDTGLSNIITLQTHYKKTNKQVFIKEVFYVILQSCSMEIYDSDKDDSSYNPFYAYLITRICQYYGKKKCYFTLQLLFWDLLFQQLINDVNDDDDDDEDDNSTKRMINLTKMMIHFIKKKILTLNILKGIENNDWTNTLSQNGKLCLTLLFTKLLESSSPPVSSFSASSTIADDNDTNDIKSYITQGVAKNEDGDMLKECMYVFLMVVMKECPKMNDDDGIFRKNWKIAMQACQKKSLDLF